MTAKEFYKTYSDKDSDDNHYWMFAFAEAYAQEVNVYLRFEKNEALQLVAELNQENKQLQSIVEQYEKKYGKLKST